MSERLPNFRLCMDARMLHAERSGVGTYADALRIAQRRLDPDSLILTDANAGGRVRRWLRALSPKGVAAREIGAPPDRELRGGDVFRLAQVWFDVHRRLLPVRVPGSAGIMHWSFPVPLRLVGWRNVYTVHDAIPLVQPALTTIDPRRHRRLLKAIAAEAERGGALVTVSEAARHEIVAALDLAPRSIVDCGTAVDRRDDPTLPLPASLGAEEFLLVCGSVEPRKNIAAIVEAYRRSGVDLPLVLAGPDPGGRRSIDPAMLDGKTIIRLPDVNTATMTALLARARALLMPSLAEGFGLPVAEAMALGTPVLTSASGALAETAGTAALLVDPRDINAIAVGIRAIVDRKDLRRELIEKGRGNARRFTPDRFATALSRLYAGLIAPAR